MTADRWPDPPAGFVVLTAGRGALYAAADLAPALRARRLDAWEGWQRALAGGASASGRGRTAILDGWRLKPMRRGGLPASLWRDRYPSAGRLVGTLAAHVDAQVCGVPTARPVALMIEPGPGPLVRGAMATEEIAGAEDLARRAKRGAATRADLESALGVIRAMHDHGVSHPDLNLGNVLLVPQAGAAPRAFVIDFDRATFSSGPLPFGARQRALRRLERSCAKITGSPGPLGPGSEDLWYELYAGGDAMLRERLARGRPLGRFTLALHRLGWRRNAG